MSETSHIPFYEEDYEDGGDEYAPFYLGERVAWVFQRLVRHVRRLARR